MAQIKKSWLGCSIALNVLLLIMLVCQNVFVDKPSSKNGKDIIGTDMLFSTEFPEDAILMIGGERMRICAWRNLIGNDRICNLSVYQNTISEEIKRADFIFDGPSPSQIILMLGMEDLKQGIPVNEVYQNFVKYVALLREKLPQTEIVIHSLMPIGPDKYNDFKNVPTENIINYNMFLKMFALEQGLVFLNMYDEFAEGDGLVPRYNTGDGFHLSVVAYRQWKDRLQSVMH